MQATSNLAAGLQVKSTAIPLHIAMSLTNGGRSLNAIWYLKIPPVQKLILQFFGSEMNFTGSFAEPMQVTRKTIAAFVGISIDTLDRGIKSLVKLGYLSKVAHEDTYNCQSASEYALTEKLFTSYAEFLAAHEAERGMDPKVASFKRIMGSYMIDVDESINAKEVNTDEGGSRKLRPGVAANCGPFTPGLSPKDLNPTVKTRAREDVPKPEPEIHATEEIIDPAMPRVGKEELKPKIAEMFKTAKQAGLFVKPDDLARAVGLAIENLGATFPAILELWPIAIAGMLERNERNPANGLFNWVKADLAYKRRQAQYDNQAQAKNAYRQNANKNRVRHQPSGYKADESEASRKLDEAIEKGVSDDDIQKFYDKMRELDEQEKAGK